MNRLPIAASISTFSKYSALVGDSQYLSTLAHLDPSRRITVAAGTARHIVRHVSRTQDLVNKKCTPGARLKSICD